jgi:farnesol dehydrogenase
MRVLVTGGTGYLGGAIVRALHARGHITIAFARNASAANLPGTAIDGDIRDLTAVRRAVDGADGVIHTAALVSIWRRRAEDFDDVNVGGLTNVLDAARAHGSGRIVYASSFLALPPAGETKPLEANDYQRTKRIARDTALKALSSGAPLVILYPGVVYGPGRATEGDLVGRLLRDHMGDRLAGIVGAERQWSFAFMDDVADLHVRAVERPDASGEYHAGGVNAPQKRLFEITREVTGRQLPRQLPATVARLAGALEEFRARITGRLPLITQGAVRILEHDWPLDSSRSIRELNYRITPLEVGMRRTLETLNGER